MQLPTASSVDLLVVHLDVVVHDDQLLMLILDVNLFDVLSLFSSFLMLLMLFLLSFSMMSSMFFALNLSCLLILLMFWMLVASMFDGLLSSLAVCISDVDAAAMF